MYDTSKVARRATFPDPFEAPSRPLTECPGFPECEIMTDHLHAGCCGTTVSSLSAMAPNRLCPGGCGAVLCADHAGKRCQACDLDWADRQMTAAHFATEAWRFECIVNEALQSYSKESKNSLLDALDSFKRGQRGLSKLINVINREIEKRHG